MRVILDTNMFYNNYRLERDDQRILLEAYETHKIYVPQIVIDELIAQYRRRIKELLADHSKFTEEFKRITGTEFEFRADLEIETLVSDYESFLKNLGTTKVTILPYPLISHQKLARRSITMTRPFIANYGEKTNQRGNRQNRADYGYRDALLWETLLELASNGEAEDIVLLSNDVSAFGVRSEDENEDGSRVLHQHLLEEINKRPDITCEISLFHDSEMFVAEHVTPSLTLLNSISSKLQSGTYQHLNLHGFLINDFVSFNSFGITDPDQLGTLFPWIFRTVSIDSIESISEISNIQVRQLSRSHLHIRFDVEMDVTLSGYIDRVTSQMRKFLPEIQSKDSSPVTTTVTAPGEFTVELVFDKEKAVVVSVEVTDMDIHSKLWHRFWQASAIAYIGIGMKIPPKTTSRGFAKLLLRLHHNHDFLEFLENYPSDGSSGYIDARFGLSSIDVSTG